MIFWPEILKNTIFSRERKHPKSVSKSVKGKKFIFMHQQHCVSPIPTSYTYTLIAFLKVLSLNKEN